MSAIISIDSADRNSVLDAVADYLARGYVPSPTTGKRAVVPGWPRLTAPDVCARIDELWPQGSGRGVALLLGSPSGGLLDVDLDCAAARAAADALLPVTGMVWGRASAPGSHRAYLCERPPARASSKFADPATGTCLAELRSTGAQTCVPPTLLPAKAGGGTELVVWRGGAMGTPERAEAGELAAAVGRVAAVALLARHWPGPGARHDAHLALAGALLRDGLAPGDVEAIVAALCTATDDPEAADRVRGVASTGAREASAGETTGWPTLARLLGDQGDVVTRAARDWLVGPSGPNTAAVGRTVDQDRAAEVHGVALTAAYRTPRQTVVSAARGGAELHRDLVALDSASARRRFAESVAASAWPDEAARPADALALIGEALLGFAVRPPRPSPAARDVEGGAADPYADPRPAALAEMPEDIVRAAVELLQAPDLFDRIARDIDALGVAGERTLAVMLYVVGTSVQLPRPLSALLVGASASGKSFTLSAVAELFPPEVLLQATDLTANALYYVREGALHHRLIVGGERSRVEDDQRAEAKRALREMLEAQVLRKLVTVSTDGVPETVLITQRGPIVYFESTTNAEVFDEDKNRCLTIYTDESSEQTRRIIVRTARSAAGLDAVDVERIKQKHHAIQRMIPRSDVVIPFAPEIEAGSILESGTSANTAVSERGIGRPPDALGVDINPYTVSRS